MKYHRFKPIGSAYEISLTDNQLKVIWFIYEHPDASVYDIGKFMRPDLEDNRVIRAIGGSHVNRLRRKNFVGKSWDKSVTEESGHHLLRDGLDVIGKK